jgi:U3 small nucleolar ribonucleoprotein component
MTQGMPVEVLESRASEQRRKVHNDVAELRSALRERLDVKKNVAPYVGPASGVAALVGLMCGWLLTGIFVD